MDTKSLKSSSSFARALSSFFVRQDEPKTDEATPPLAKPKVEVATWGAVAKKTLIDTYVGTASAFSWSGGSEVLFTLIAKTNWNNGDGCALTELECNALIAMISNYIAIGLGYSSLSLEQFVARSSNITKNTKEKFTLIINAIRDILANSATALQFGLYLRTEITRAIFQSPPDSKVEGSTGEFVGIVLAAFVFATLANDPLRDTIYQSIRNKFKNVPYPLKLGAHSIAVFFDVFFNFFKKFNTGRAVVFACQQLKDAFRNPETTQPISGTFKGIWTRFGFGLGFAAIGAPYNIAYRYKEDANLSIFEHLQMHALIMMVIGFYGLMLVLSYLSEDKPHSIMQPTAQLVLFAGITFFALYDAVKAKISKNESSIEATPLLNPNDGSNDDESWLGSIKTTLPLNPNDANNDHDLWLMSGPSINLTP